MNRTEHKLRLAFDPEYEAKWREVEKDRAAVRRVTIKMMWSRSLLVLFFWLGAMTYILSRSWLAAFVVPVVFWVVESGLYAWVSDRRKREELGI